VAATGLDRVVVLRAPESMNAAAPMAKAGIVMPSSLRRRPAETEQQDAEVRADHHADEEAIMAPPGSHTLGTPQTMPATLTGTATTTERLTSRHGRTAASSAVQRDQAHDRRPLSSLTTNSTTAMTSSA